METASAEKAEVDALLKRSAFGALHCGLHFWLEIGNVMQASEMKENKHGLRERLNCWKAKKVIFPATSAVRRLGFCTPWSLPLHLGYSKIAGLEDEEGGNPTVVSGVQIMHWLEK